VKLERQRNYHQPLLNKSVTFISIMPLLSPVPEKKAKGGDVRSMISAFSPEGNNNSFSGLGQALSFEDGHIRVAVRTKPNIIRRKFKAFGSIMYHFINNNLVSRSST
jgi:hypothetical protein